jgi:hypothetical protein
LTYAKNNCRKFENIEGLNQKKRNEKNKNRTSKNQNKITKQEKKATLFQIKILKKRVFSLKIK